MAIYNFAKDSSKNLSDTHTEMRLKDQHVDAPETVTQQQLEKKDRKGEEFEITEKQLDKVRTGGAEIIIEKNLNDSKGLFGSKFRNDEAFMGDINKIEEKRLSGKKTEDEKYEPASSTPKKLKWWDSLKKANSDKTVKTARSDELDFSEGEEWSRMDRDLENIGANPEEEGILPDKDYPPPENPSSLEEDSGDDDTDVVGKIYVTKNKEGKTPLPHIFMELSFDPDAFTDDTAIKEAALEKVLEARPNLADKISVDDFSKPKSSGIDSFVTLRLMGEQYFTDSTEDQESPFLRIETDDVDVGGTPMKVGKVILGPQSEGMEHEVLLSELVDYISDKTHLEVSPESIQINLPKKEATFAFENVNYSDDENGNEDLLPAEEDIGETGENGEIKPQVSPPVNPKSFSPAKSDSVKALEKELQGLLAGVSLDFPIVIADSKKK